MGNNEVVGPFGAGTVFGIQAPGRAFIRASLAVKATRLGQFLDALKWRLAGGKTPATWEGMEMFLDQQIRQKDPRMSAVYDSFQKNLDDILALAEGCGAKVLLSTVSSNLKDCPPFASLHRNDLTTAQLADWNRLFQSGTNQEATGQFSAALTNYQQAAKLDAQYAELWFRVGRCQWALSNYADARKSFEQARDQDTLRFRADTRLNQTIRNTAAKQAGDQLKLVDAVAVFAEHSPHGITGDELLYEHVHPNYQGHYLLARKFAEQLTGFLPATVTQATTNPPASLSAAECSRRLAYTAWDRLQVADEIYKRLQQPPFTHQLDHETHIENTGAKSAPFWTPRSIQPV